MAGRLDEYRAIAASDDGRSGTTTTGGGASEGGSGAASGATSGAATPTQTSAPQPVVTGQSTQRPQAIREGEPFNIREPRNSSNDSTPRREIILDTTGEQARQAMREFDERQRGNRNWPGNQIGDQTR